MLDAILSSIEHVAEGWSKEVSKRRRLTSVDPVADTLEYVAGELAAEVARLRDDCRALTPEQYAEAKGAGVSAQTVRNWIRAGELDAVRGPRGWLIPAAAERRKKASAA